MTLEQRLVLLTQAIAVDIALLQSYHVNFLPITERSGNVLKIAMPERSLPILLRNGTSVSLPVSTSKQLPITLRNGLIINAFTY